MMRRYVALIAISGLIFVALGQTLVLEASVLDGGGRKLLSADYVCGFSIGQSIASGLVTSSGYRAILGFWNRPFRLIGIEEGQVRPSQVKGFRLSPCCPNPFGLMTVVRYELGFETDVSLKVLDHAGRTVGSLVQRTQKPGKYKVTWNLAGVSKGRLPNGIYFLRLVAGEFSAVQKAVIAR